MNGLSSLGFTVASENVGQRLDSVLSARMPEISRSKIQKLILDKRVLLNGVPVKKNERLRQGDVVAIDAKESHDVGHERARAQDIDLDVVYEDEYLLAVNKPAGMVVHPGKGNPDNTLVNALLFHVPSLSKGFEIQRPGIVHRLDKDTSGILLVAKTDVAHAALAKMFFEPTDGKKLYGIMRRFSSEGTCHHRRAPLEEINATRLNARCIPKVKTLTPNTGFCIIIAAYRLCIFVRIPAVPIKSGYIAQAWDFRYYATHYTEAEKTISTRSPCSNVLSHINCTNVLTARPSMHIEYALRTPLRKNLWP